MTKPRMFDVDATKKHIGTKIKFRNRLECLKEVEDYFIDKCNQERIDYSFDCTANENTFYNTINYTTYAGMFVMHPLCYSAQMFQMYDAKADCMDSVGHVEWVTNQIEQSTISKYVAPDDSELQSESLDKYTAVVVLPGSNKIYEHTSSNKLKKIIERHGKQLILKPHPITKKEVIQDLEQVKDKSVLADKHSNLYDIIRGADIVYTSHISETALTSLILGKRISPMEVFERRLIGAFSHINHFCFSEPNPLEVLDKIFASPKSGVIHPDVDKDWKDKIDKYFKYTLAMRKLQVGHYYD